MLDIIHTFIRLDIYIYIYEYFFSSYLAVGLFPFFFYSFGAFWGWLTFNLTVLDSGMDMSLSFLQFQQALIQMPYPILGNMMELLAF